MNGRLTGGYGVVVVCVGSATGDTCIPTHAGISHFYRVSFPLDAYWRLLHPVRNAPLPQATQTALFRLAQIHLVCYTENAKGLFVSGA